MMGRLGEAETDSRKPAPSKVIRIPRKGEVHFKHFASVDVDLPGRFVGSYVISLPPYRGGECNRLAEFRIGQG